VDQACVHLTYTVILISLRWQILARDKLAEVDALMVRAQRMQTLLGQALACGCLRLDDCAKAMRSCGGQADQSC
jgi:hypothetical protein